MECLYPKDCINTTSHLESKIKKRNIDTSFDLPELKKLKISDHIEVLEQSSKRYKNSYTNIEKTKIPVEEEKKNKTLSKIETIEKKLRLFKMCTSKYIDHLQDELDELKGLID